MKNKKTSTSLAIYAALLGATIATLAPALFKQDREPVAFLRPTANKYEVAQTETSFIETATGYGSGIAIHRSGNTFIWTANHVVRDCNTVEIHRLLHFSGHKAGKITFAGLVIARFPAIDAALLWVDCPSEAFTPARFAKTITPVGSAIFSIGNFHGPAFDGSLTRGIISQIGVFPAKSGWPWILVDQGDFRTVPGASGGPVFRESDGAVIGIVVGGPNQGGEGISCFIPVRELARLGPAWALFGEESPDGRELSKLAALAAITKPEPPKITVPTITVRP